MSETSATSTTSFINTSTECIAKPPLSSDSSIDSGFSAMTTSDSITVNQSSTGSTTKSLVCNQRRQESARRTLSMLPPQPLVPPPPPPSQANMYETSGIYDKRASVVPQYASQSSMNNDMSTQNISIYSDSNYYATYAQSSRPNNDKPQSLNQTNQTSQLHQSSPNQTHPFQHQQSLITQRSSTSSLESASSAVLMPMNAKAMLLHGLPSEEVLRNWLLSLKCEEHIENFIYHGYDIHLVTRMTPQDLAAIGCKSPALRKKLLAEIKKLNLDYEIPNYELSMGLDKWLESLKLSQYHTTLIQEGYESIDKVCKLTWEDLEEIGIVKLGHQKRLLMGIDKIEKAAKQLEESQNDSAIYDVHPNHRVSLNGAENRLGTIGRGRSGFFQTRSGANLDHRGLPVATVMPALKHVNGSLLHQADGNQQQYMTQMKDATQTHSNINGEQFHEGLSKLEAFKLNDLNSATMRRQPPPLPPVRTNSLKIVQGNGLSVQPIYGSNYGGLESNIYGTQPTNSTSFLRTPKLGTLTTTTNKMLASGGHIQTISTNGTRIVPIREAPLPPVQQAAQLPYQPNLMPGTIPEKIEEEPTAVSNMNQQHNFPLPPPNCDLPNASFINNIGNQSADGNEFPPPPPPTSEP